MRELTRTNDPVFLSYLRAQLLAEGIEPLVLDAYASSVLEPMNATALQRVMVADEDYWPAWAVSEEASEQVREDTLLGGRVKILQPVNGFRAAIDPVFLAATVAAMPGDQVLDVGSGTGAAALALRARIKGVSVTGMDVQPGLIALATRSAARNGFEETTRFIEVDIAQPPSAVLAMKFDHVMSNPPFLVANRGQRPKDQARALATIESSADLATWLRFMDGRLRDGGTLSVIHRADRANEITDALHGRYGDIEVIDLVSVDDGRPVKRCIVRALKGAGSGTVSQKAFVVHEADGTYTDMAHLILRDGKALTIS